MRVAFLVHGPEVSGCRYRVLQYLPYLKDQGVEASVCFYGSAGLSRFGFYRTLDRYDAVYLHRKLFSPLEFWYVRKKARKLVFDFDDALMYRSSGSKNPHSVSRRLKFSRTVKGVDWVVAGNEFLKSETLPYQPNVSVVPTSIDLSRYGLKGASREDEGVIVGWMGSASTLKYLSHLMPALERVAQRCPQVRLKIVCDRFLESSLLRVIKKPWSSEEEITDLQSFDIGIMPLSDDPWSRGKCALKIIQYFGVGVPVVCSPVGMNRDIVEDGVNGFWASKEGEWEDRLVRLVEAKDLRREMGLQGRRTVERGFTVEVNGPRILNILRQVVGA